MTVCYNDTSLQHHSCYNVMICNNTVTYHDTCLVVTVTHHYNMPCCYNNTHHYTTGCYSVTVYNNLQCDTPPQHDMSLQGNKLSHDTPLQHDTPLKCNRMSQYYILLWNCCCDVTNHYNMTLQFKSLFTLSKYIQNVI